MGTILKVTAFTRGIEPVASVLTLVNLTNLARRNALTTRPQRRSHSENGVVEWITDKGRCCRDHS